MKQLVNNNFHYYLGMVLPFLIPSLAIFTLFSPFENTFYGLYNYHEIRVAKEMLREDPNNIDMNNWRGHKIVICANASVSILDKKGNSVVYIHKNQELMNKINEHFRDHNYNKMLDNISI